MEIAEGSACKQHIYEGMACVALALTVFCNILFGHSVVGNCFSQLFTPLLQRIYPYAIDLLVFACMLLDRPIRSKFDALFTLSLVTVFWVATEHTGYEHLYSLVLVLLAIRTVPIDKLLLTFLWSSLVALVVIVCLDSLPSTPSNWRNPNGIWVCAYGFAHPNSFGYLLFGVLTSMTLAIDRKRLRLPLACVSFACAGFAYFGLSCRSGAMLMALLGVFVLLEGHLPAICSFVHYKPIFCWTLTTIIGGLALLMVVCVVFYSPDNWVCSLVDKLTNLRLRFGHRAYEVLGGLSKMGTHLPYSNEVEAHLQQTPFLFIDSAYLWYPIVMGTIPSAFFYLLYVRAIWHLEDELLSGMLWAVLLLYALYFMTERAPAYLIFNCTLLFLSRGLATSETCVSHVPAHS